jgi:3-hydroxyisobutyrate dehydrogenase-like beta-hydroxyacid dehydrogenase
MCKNLVEKGQLDKPLIIFNRSQKRATDLNATLPSGKSVVASSIDEVVSKADIIFACVGNDTAINETIDAALKSGPKGKLFVVRLYPNFEFRSVGAVLGIQTARL